MSLSDEVITPQVNERMNSKVVTHVFKVSEVVSTVLQCIGSAVPHIVLLWRDVMG
jgi:hypothetical protein